MEPLRNDRGAYRCSVAPENAEARLKISNKLYRVAVLDTSRDGFTVRMPNSTAFRLKDGGTFLLHFCGERWEVKKESVYNDGDEFSNIGLSRIRDLTRNRVPSSFFYLFSNYQSLQSDPGFLICLLLAFLFACIALPGVGDSLGTAPKIRSGIHFVVDSLRSSL